MGECEHSYQFLRQEKRNIGYDRNPTWAYTDIFFCEKCLAYKEKVVRKTQPSPRSFYEEIEVYT